MLKAFLIFLTLPDSYSYFILFYATDRKTDTCPFFSQKEKSDDGQNALFQKPNTKNASCTGL